MVIVMDKYAKAAKSLLKGIFFVVNLTNIYVLKGQLDSVKVTIRLLN